MELDATDRGILKLLREDGRISVAALAERVHVSRTHAYSRLNRLHSLGVITGYRAVVDPSLSGRKESAYVFLKARQSSWRELKAALLELEELEHYALVGGEFDVVLLIRAADSADLRRILFDRIQAMPGVVDARTSIIFEDGEGPL
ncbi:Lrp/AsnC family transcriptional regulator [Falsarthrobacter nasiphocae]|uniref:Lrp/AsnC family transcriptional regulator n=1 Tax=Falsarthrobacter nasiphocae TaxID=189863 RepID=UPI0031E1DA21